MRFALLLSAAAALSACSVLEQPSGLISHWTAAWRDVATPDDRLRLANWRSTFTKALEAARKAGHAAEIAAEGALLEPDAALSSPAIPDGLYRCRVIKIGAKEPGLLDYVTYPAFTCRVKADRQLQRLDKLTGSQRYVGLIFPADSVRSVFLGTLSLGDEIRAFQYAQDATRDVAGHVERIGDRRWRLVMPQPRFESQLDVMELTPQPVS